MFIINYFLQHSIGTLLANYKGLAAIKALTMSKCPSLEATSRVSPNLSGGISPNRAHAIIAFTIPRRPFVAAAFKAPLNPLIPSAGISSNRSHAIIAFTMPRWPDLEAPSKAPPNP